ncbi:hypothetical protein [Desulforamulus putei]|uniref:Uncharacterized protein n=1 Tax=Desulforamulus putei DSM 12395 TaxID=1121429 RepID=A0A1M4URL1_9FIRM|nr:hypothetical protein [Desulforamulus putei]SHE59240.1 hypothetical protein SAMN02745133_00737 [Desulforamulus putei DSM 12395]
MGTIPLYLYFTLAILEGLSVFFFIFAFARVNWAKKELLLFSIIYAILTFVLRKLPISFGIHSLLLICLVGVFVSYYYKVKLSSSLFSMILVYTVIIMTEILTAFLFSHVFLIQFDIIFHNPLWWFLSGLPHVIFIFIFGLVIKNVRRQE